MTKRALIVGGTGLVGKCVVKHLLTNDQFSHVTMLTRRKTTWEHYKLEEKVIDFDSLENVLVDLDTTYDVVYCCLGTTMKKARSKRAFLKVDFDYPLAVAKWVEEVKIPKLLIITAIGANASSPFFYSRVKGELELKVRSLQISTVYFIRPSLLLGDRNEFRTGEKIGEWLGKVLQPVMIGKWKKYRSIAAKDVASAMIRLSLENAHTGKHTIESSALQDLANERVYA
ncbi:NAD(P)H-binding protein [Mangrovibacillus cuniculi]|uniref:NAD(P)H-binding protein n=1 Tax=Mangrovibacillus cuniculi TaxID=2593652 RepID=A0A7S8C968_9BACI|nr:NAD(P)H-binding protein [Mangrovibacillus cuniculi]QPC45730.1 NAD(P)H-binding protein [Mangrovibacillus cuniculi]